MQGLEVFGFMGGLVGLILSADAMVEGALGVAYHRQWSDLWVGTLLIGAGTTAPELLVSMLAVWHGSPALALGNALGSYVANIGMVLGGVAVLHAIRLNPSLLRRELPVMAAALVLVGWVLWDGWLGRQEGVLLLVVLLGLLVAFGRVQHTPVNVGAMERAEHAWSLKRCWVYVVAGGIALVASADLMVVTATALARSWGVSERLIGVSVVAVGTSLPELAATWSSVRKGAHDVALGNVLGSNVLGVLGVVAVPALWSPGPIDAWGVHHDVVWMGCMTALMAWACWPARCSQADLNRWRGGVLLVGFLAYQANLLWPVSTWMPSV